MSAQTVASQAATWGDARGTPPERPGRMIAYVRLLFKSYGARVEGQPAVMLLQTRQFSMRKPGGVHEQLPTPVTALIRG